MRLDAGAGQARRRGPLHLLDARLKLLVALGFVIAVVSTPAGQWRVLGGFGLLLAFVLGLTGTEPAVLLRRWAAFLLLAGFLTALIAPGLPDSARLGVSAVALSILARNSLAFLMMLALAETTTWSDLLRALRRLGVPAVLVATLQFMERYLHVLLDEMNRMTRARRARSFRRGGLSWPLLSSMIGMLLLRSFERAERVHSAMLSRGWDGTIRSLDD